MYRVYVEKYRNLDYLEHQLDEFNRAEEEKLKNTEKILANLRKDLQDEELRQIRGDR
jgi:clusterin-associated protein 1